MTNQTCQVFQGEDCANPATVTFRWTSEGVTATLPSCDDHYTWALGDLLTTEIAPWIDIPHADELEDRA